MQAAFAFEALPTPPREDPTAEAGQKSHARVFAPGMREFDPYRFRVMFPDHWAGFLRSHFRNPEHVAVAFGVTYQTARNWWDGINRPSGDKVAIAAVSMPRRFQSAFGGME